MVYNIKKSNGSPLVTIPDSTQDTTSTSLVLPGRNSVNFGLAIDQNLVDLLQNFANTSPPPSPQQGQLWYNTISMVLNVYDGAKWVAITTAFDGSGGMTNVAIGPNNTDVTVVISQYQIITVISGARIEHGDCPDSIVFNDISYSFAPRFPNGIYPGVNLATDPTGVVSYWFNGRATLANALARGQTVTINGSSTGSFKFDGTSNVSLTVSDSNVYITNAAGFTTNVTVAGTWSKVLVSDGGRILNGNNLNQTDIVTALGYTPYDGGNVDTAATANTIVGRDMNASFAANVIIAASMLSGNVEAVNQMVAPAFLGTASNAHVLTTSRKIYINGDTYGNVAFDGSTDVILSTEMVTSGVLPGNYNLVNVDAKGRVTNGIYESQVPIGAIMLFAEGFAPSGWGLCNGSQYSGSTGTLFSPNLIIEAGNVSASASQAAGSSVRLNYLVHYDDIPSTELTPGTPGTGPTIVINNTTTVQSPYAAPISTRLTGGPQQTQIPQGWSNVNIVTVGLTAFNPSETFQNTAFANTLYFNALAYIMSVGDTNGIMFADTDEWRNLASLTIADVKDNLGTRSRENLPAFIGKYMIPLRLISQQMQNLGIPSNTPFSPLLQDQLVSSISSNFAHQLAVAGIPPIDNNIFGCHYLGSADAWVAVIRSQKTALVSDVLRSKGYYVSATSELTSYTRDQLVTKLAEIMQLAKSEVLFRESVNQNVITSGQYVSSTSSNVIVTTEAIDGIKIGNSDFTDMQGGYFPYYEATGVSKPGSASIGTGGPIGAAGTVTLTLSDAGAAALAAVLQTSNIADQGGLAQLCINKTGATVAGYANFGSTAFDVAVKKDQYSALSAAIYGPNANTHASQIYGELFIDPNYLKTALSAKDDQDLQTNLEQMFKGTITQAQKDRITTLRSQVYNNGPEVTQAQAAIGSALNFVEPDSSNPNVKKPYGSDASGYVIFSTSPGFYVPNSSSAAGSSPAVSPAALLDRVRAKRITAVSNSNSNANVVTNTQTTNIPGATDTSSGVDVKLERTPYYVWGGDGAVFGGYLPPGVIPISSGIDGIIGPSVEGIGYTTYGFN